MQARSSDHLLSPVRARRAKPSHARAGITLTEVVISIPLVGLVMVGAMSSTGAVLRTWNQTAESYSAVMLAEDLMAEILQQHYEEPDGSASFGLEGEGQGNRKKWDDVDDYRGWTKSPPRDKNNTVLTGANGWSRSVQIAYAQLSNPTADATSDEGLKRITVTVTDPIGKQTSLVAYRSRWGAMEQPPILDRTVHSYVSHQMDTTVGTLRSGTAVPNHAE